MILDLLAMVCAGVGVAGLYLGIQKMTKGTAPKWMLPAVIGAGMLGYSVWSEYSWYGRVTAVLPEQIDIVLVPEDHSIIRPWTFLFPPNTRFMALDRTVLQVSQTNPSFRQAELMFVERWMPTQRVPIAFDCAGGQQADLVDGGIMAADGTLRDAKWVDAAPGDALQTAACKS